MKPLSALMATSLFALSGCMNLAPDYNRAPAPIPGVLTFANPVEEANPLQWGDIVVSDPLRQIITAALTENRDLRATAANVRAARARLVSVRANMVPLISASGSGREGDTFNTGDSSQLFSDSASVQVGASAWEMDLFGRLANNNEAALQSYLASAEGERAMRISLVGSICEAWLQLAADKELLALARDTVANQSESLELTTALLETGAASELDMRRASASVQSARAQQAQFQAFVRQDMNLLRLLVGADLPEGALEQASLFPSPVIAAVPVSASSDILLSRPDIVAAEHQLLAANARIGVARAAYFPSISLTGSVGYASADLGDLFTGGGAGGWTFGPNVSLPIFDGGARRGNLDVAKANRDAALASYESAIQSAFRETADALQVTETIDTRLSALEQLTEDTEVTLYLSEERFKTGIDDYLTVLDAQREDYSSRQLLIAARLDRGRNTVALFRALGNWDGKTAE